MKRVGYHKSLWHCAGDRRAPAADATAVWGFWRSGCAIWRSAAERRRKYGENFRNPVENAEISKVWSD
jgi:hypothetical protein